MTDIPVLIRARRLACEAELRGGALEGGAVMSDQGFKPVRHDGKKALEKAMQRPGFKEAWEARADEYAALRSLLEARKQWDSSR